MKKPMALLLSLALLLAPATGCTSKISSSDGPTAVMPENAAESSTSAPAEDTEPAELIVFAAASMQETLNEIGKRYEAAHPQVTVTFNFDSSGTLKTQIQEGADCDIFISAGQKQMNQLDITASADVNTEGLDFVIADTRGDILENKVTLCVPEGNGKGIQSFDDMAAGMRDGSIFMAMGNSDVPVGQYTQKIFAYYDLDEAAMDSAGLLTYGSNVKEVTSQISEGTVDCGVIYCTDAFSAGLTIVDYATAEMCGQVIYPAAVMNVTQHEDAARSFLDFCYSAEAMEIFQSVGFSPVEE